MVDDVQTGIEEKGASRKESELGPSAIARQRYETAKSAAKWAVKVAKERTQNNFCQQLEDESIVAGKKINKLAKMRKDVQEDKMASPFINNADGKLRVVGFVDLEKAYDRRMIPQVLRKYCVPKDLTEMAMAVYRTPSTRMRTCFGVTETFQIKVGSHQGSALSPLLFIILLDYISIGNQHSS